MKVGDLIVRNPDVFNCDFTEYGIILSIEGEDDVKVMWMDCFVSAYRYSIYDLEVVNESR